MTIEKEEYFDDFESNMKIALHHMKTTKKIFDKDEKNYIVKKEATKKRDFFRIKKNAHRYSEIVFHWIDDFTKSEVANTIFSLTDDYLLYYHRPNLHFIIQRNGYIEIAIFEPNIFRNFPHYKKTIFKNKQEIIDFIDSLNVASCGNYISWLRLLEEMAMDIIFVRINDTFLENIRNWPKEPCQCCRLRNENITELVFEGRVIKR